jgi:integrase
VLHRLSVLSKAHQLREALNPARDPGVQELVRRIPRAYAARGAVPGRKAALTKDPLEAMLATCTIRLIGIRDRALLLFAFSSGGRRRSEVAAAVHWSVAIPALGPGGVRIEAVSRSGGTQPAPGGL